MACARKKHSGCNPIAKIRIVSASKRDTMFQPFVKRHAKANLQLPSGTCFTSHRKRFHFFRFFRLTCTPRSGCVNQSVVSIRQFADASSLGSVPSSMEMAGSCKCCIHRRQRYKIVPSIVVNTRQEYAIHTWTF